MRTLSLRTFGNVGKISGPKQSMKSTDYFICTSANVIYCITCTLCKNLYIGETRRQLDDRFREHLCDAKKDDKNASKPVSLRPFPASRKHGKPQNSIEQKFIFKSALLILKVYQSTNTFHSTNLFCCFSRYLAPTNSVAPSFFI